MADSVVSIQYVKDFFNSQIYDDEKWAFNVISHWRFICSMIRRHLSDPDVKDFLFHRSVGWEELKAESWLLIAQPCLGTRSLIGFGLFRVLHVHDRSILGDVVFGLALTLGLLVVLGLILVFGLVLCSATSSTLPSMDHSVLLSELTVRSYTNVRPSNCIRLMIEPYLLNDRSVMFTCCECFTIQSPTSHGLRGCVNKVLCSKWYEREFQGGMSQLVIKLVWANLVRQLMGFQLLHPRVYERPKLHIHTSPNSQVKVVGQYVLHVIYHDGYEQRKRSFLEQVLEVDDPTV
ncbi:hypothetical protein V8G54_016023 [Vigna mungo]|uniref:Uncharacterized protein n=1 Tax=Vigna mungo TaxID=3915 RepID=A0AAQ3S019_VIGMU